MATWWDNATQEQRLAQIDGAIECGMSTRQFLVTIGESNPTRNRQVIVRNFARYHQRTFFNGSTYSENHRKTLSLNAHRKNSNQEIEIPGAFSIFSETEHRDNLFNAHQND